MVAGSKKRHVKVLVVDDSAFMRKVITEALEQDPSIKVIGTARNGTTALEKVRELSPDVVSLDYMMPEKDGLDALQELVKDYAMPVVMVSSYTPKGADVTMRALELGAVDFVLKPRVRGEGLAEFQNELIHKVKIASVSVPQPLRVTRRRPLVSVAGPETLSKIGRLVVIGSSTGGPQALQKVVPMIPKDIRATIVIIQHMPEKFTKSLAQRLDQLSELHVTEAKDGDKVKKGNAYINPGGFHMRIDGDGVLSLNQEPPIGGLRPRVDVLMESAARHFRDDVIGIVLTGMGNDGARGMTAIKKAGGRTMVQEESTCVVSGMPKSVIKAGCADKEMPLNQIPHELLAMVSGR